MFDYSDIRLKDAKVFPCKKQDLKRFIETWHYSQNVIGVSCKYGFRLMYENNMLGAMIYGRMAIANTWKAYGDSDEEVLELRRLCCVDDTPKNAESYFIAYTLKWLKNNTNVKTIVSYADSTHGHEGTIYKASNFELVGVSPAQKVISYKGKNYHDRVLRSKLKSGNLSHLALELKQALDQGVAEWVQCKPKNIYVYNLR